ncbi:hypothetical protein MTP99_012085 [Tenebrio molitor]|nr:hypothetical protein MTP99_012085 [Tenebrio molitor]CAH1370500.1 unnamed protein product [Tenebrio molitor]
MKVVFLASVVLFLAWAQPGESAECPPTDGAYPVFIPTADCTQYYMCSNGHPYLFTCPPLTLFNININVCDWAYNVECRNPEECLAD